uniref:RNA polymerase beta'' subunit n=1 Tax=Dictyotopsis propagulifera TaxID=670095 RepID=UPI002E772EAF|nr:RNA polymerase beta'' subunit [Dictyotopsis propagulifera]WAM63222.1 RNA polymerase beta'' subunit [Dictyotopsis propagulifera]
MIKKSKIFFNNTVDKKELKKIINWAFNIYGHQKVAYFIDQLKRLGFQYATASGISISLEDLRVPPFKKLLMYQTGQEIHSTQAETNNGEITEVERFQKIIYLWNLTSETLKDRLIDFFRKRDPLNSIYIMAFSGARGNIGQVRQLIGMRGLMSDPNGQIIDQAISTNFREGLSITDYIISSYGARKGIVDTAVKTADSGYLTRRLVEITQNLIISELDCQTERSVILKINKLMRSDNYLHFIEKANGRTLASSIFKPKTGEIIAKRNQQLNSELLKILDNLNVEYVSVRSPLICECRRSVCQRCYGRNMASGNLVELGEAVGLIAAQSIGEPGTQLTMRTFHTGGVFTSQLARQGRANCTGYVRFVPTYLLKPFRTIYGQNAYLSERESFLRILTYSNKITEVKIDARTIILAKNYSCIKVGDVLFEAAPSSNDQSRTQKEMKYVVAQRSGELVLENNKSLETKVLENKGEQKNKNFVFWILSGEVFSIPFGSQIKARKFEKILKNQSIAQSKVTTTISGFVHILKNENNVTSLKIQNYFKILNKFKFFIQKDLSEVQACKVYLSSKYDITIKPYSYENKVLIGLLNNKQYKTKTGGKFYSFNFPFIKQEGKNRIKPKKHEGSTIFFVPQSTIQTVSKKKSFNFKEGTYVHKNSEIFPYYRTNVSGFISYKFDKTIKTITILPGKRYFLLDKNIDIESYNHRVYFPGETFLDNFEIDFLSYLQIVKHFEITILYFIPISRYEVTKENQFRERFFPEVFFKLEENSFVVKSGEKIQTDNPIQFISYPIRVGDFLTKDKTEIFFEIHKPQIKNSSGEVFIGNSETLIIENLVPKEIKKKEILIDILVEEKQFVESYSTIISLNILMPWSDYIYTIKTKSSIKNTRILLTTTSDYKILFFEDFNHSYKQNSLNRVDSLFDNNLLLKESGFFQAISGNYLRFQLAEPYLFSKGAIVRKLPGDFVHTQESLGQLIYQRLKTGDIIQGLPKIDELLEARKPKSEALLATNQGLLVSIRRNQNKIFLTIKPHFDINEYEISSSIRVLVKKFQYICVGEPLTEGQINPHRLLQVYFRYFFSLQTLSLYESTYYSIKKLQTLLLKSVQNIYKSQGVIISDKHIELILKEITKKVYIEYIGETNFLPGDIIDLDQAEYINKSLKQKDKLFYRPILLGITKSSLKVDGFLAAASFQETTRVLTQAAIQGRTDWLQGLKESAITGRLIPAGTGFYKNQDIVYNHITLPNPNNKKEFLNLTNHLTSRQIVLKKMIEFKYNYNRIIT